MNSPLAITLRKEMRKSEVWLKITSVDDFTMIIPHFNSYLQQFRMIIQMIEVINKDIAAASWS